MFISESSSYINSAWIKQRSNFKGMFHQHLGIYQQQIMWKCPMCTMTREREQTQRESTTQAPKVSLLIIVCEQKHLHSTPKLEGCRPFSKTVNIQVPTA